jgi:hypothetical protein
MMQALSSVWQRGGVAGFYQGLIPWVCIRLFAVLHYPSISLQIGPDVHVTLVIQAWIEASTKGAVLIFTSSEIESRTIAAGLSPAAAGLIGGMGGGVAQAYLTMGSFPSPPFTFSPCYSTLH